MTALVMDDLARLDALMRAAACLDRFDRLVLQLRWGEGLTRAETALALDADAARVLAAEMRVRNLTRDR
jgi:hypothetical protein